jgi:DNA-binding XRE family transcriptional regulator
VEGTIQAVNDDYSQLHFSHHYQNDGAARSRARHTHRSPSVLRRHLACVLMSIREGRSLSQDDLGAKSGYHRTYIGQLERGEKGPSLRTIFNLASSLEVTLGDDRSTGRASCWKAIGVNPAQCTIEGWSGV